MEFVLTLISDPAARALDDEQVARAKGVLAGGGCRPGDIAWLSQDVACDIFFNSDSDLHNLRGKFSAAIPAALNGAPLDAVIQPDGNRRKQLLVADMDSTIINQECLDELADFAGLKTKVSSITKRAMAGEIDFEPALRERVGLLKGLREDVLTEVYKSRITLKAGAKEMVQTMRAHGAMTCLVSGGFTFFTKRIADAAGFEFHRGNILQSEDGALTGKVGEPILGQQAKLDTLKAFQKQNGLTADQSLAVGDGANDLEMIKAAGMGVAFHANQIVADAADANIRHGDLTALLYIQGYRDDEIAARA